MDTATLKELQIFCPVCSDLFPTPSTLKKHVFEWHPNTSEAEIAEEITKAQHVQVLDLNCKLPLVLKVKEESRTTNNKKATKKVKKFQYSKVIGMKKKFKTKGNKKSVKNSLECEICLKTFTNSAYVKLHKVLHTGEKPFSCDICHKKFYFRSQECRHRKLGNCAIAKLHNATNRHERKETKVKHELNMIKEELNYVICGKSDPVEIEYSCDICNLSFNDLSHFQTHRKLHSSTKSTRVRFSCENCGKYYVSETNLIDHIRKDHQGNIFVCEVCDKKFSNQYDLYNHFSQHSSNNNNEKCDT